MGGKDIIYFDETTANIWEKRTRTWQYPHDPIVQRIPNTRGGGLTVYGAISSLLPKMFYHLGTSTNNVELMTFFTALFRKIIDPSNTVVVLDNHAAHKSLDFRNWCEGKGIILLFLPPNASFLNQVERMWSFFKSHYSRMIMPLDGNFNVDQLGVLVSASLDEIADKASELVKGPLKAMESVMSKHVGPIEHPYPV